MIKTAYNESIKNERGTNKMKKTVLQLETVSCPSCIRRIEGALVRLQGVQTAIVKFNASKVEVEHDETIVTAESLAQVISNLGYKVLNVK